ncbi:hypothetical protein FA13DRAFT_1712374 [Coprinellus micaceus]|uniref:Uncharacterized protein n=1 Tax=Coprinellus micaceus TaxID=71717 RepID=A0A4Y7T0J7_COPMI|nr:hypothetical protein FA13DRAFT_1712374 [Coprinellus micaceus]
MPPVRHSPLPSTCRHVTATGPYPDQIAGVQPGYFSGSMIAAFLHAVVRHGDKDPNLKYRRVIRRIHPMVLVTFDSVSDTLKIFAIPKLGGGRVGVEKWDQLRRTHEFTFPVCMCGLEVSVFKVTNSITRPQLNGKSLTMTSLGDAILPEVAPSVCPSRVLSNGSSLLDDARAGSPSAGPSTPSRSALAGDMPPPTGSTATPSSNGLSRTARCILSTESPTVRVQREAAARRLTRELGAQIGRGRTVDPGSTVMGSIPQNLIPSRTPPSLRELRLSTPISILLEMDRQDIDAGVNQGEIKRAITRCDDCGLQRTTNTYLSHICPPKPLTVAEKAAREVRLHSPLLILLEMDKHDGDSGVYDDEISRAIKKCLKCGIFRTLTYFDAHATACAQGLTSNSGLFNITIDLTGEDSD